MSETGWYRDWKIEVQDDVSFEHNGRTPCTPNVERKDEVVLYDANGKEVYVRQQIGFRVQAPPYTLEIKT